MYTAGRVVVRSLLTLYFCLPSLGYADEDTRHSFECKAEESYLEFLKGFESPSSQKESFSCFQSLEEANLESALIIDIRPSREFQQVHIPHSINLSSTKLFNTTALRSRPVLIVDQGFHRTEMARLCAKAKTEGFDNFRILLGGVAAWHAAGNELQGLPEHFSDLHNIGPREFLQELKQNRVSILSTDTYSSYLEEIAFPELIVSRLNPELAFERQLISHFQRLGSDQLFPTVLLGAGEMAEGAPAALRSVFVLNSPAHQLAAAYQSHLAVAGKRQAVPERYKCGG